MKKYNRIQTLFFEDHGYRLDIIVEYLVSMHDRFECIYEENVKKKMIS